jgi:hypothetical protein
MYIYISSKYTKNGTMKFSNLEILKFHGTIFDIFTTLRLKLKIWNKIIISKCVIKIIIQIYIIQMCKLNVCS